MATSKCKNVTTRKASAVPRPPKPAKSGRGAPGERGGEGPGAAVGAPRVWVAPAQADHRDVRDREREHRAEGVDVAQERRLPGDHRQARDRAEDEDADPRRPVVG